MSTGGVPGDIKPNDNPDAGWELTHKLEALSFIHGQLRWLSPNRVEERVLVGAHGDQVDSTNNPVCPLLCRRLELYLADALFRLQIIDPDRRAVVLAAAEVLDFIWTILMDQGVQQV